MHDLAEREQVMELVQTLPDEQIHYVLNVIQSLPQSAPKNDFSLETAIDDARNQKNLTGPFFSARDAVAAMLED